MTDREIKRLKGYVDAVSEADDPKPCRYGHFDCALVKGGKCSNEAYAQIPFEEW